MEVMLDLLSVMRIIIIIWKNISEGSRYDQRSFQFGILLDCDAQQNCKCQPHLSLRSYQCQETSLLSTFHHDSIATGQWYMNYSLLFIEIVDETKPFFPKIVSQKFFCAEVQNMKHVL